VLLVGVALGARRLHRSRRLLGKTNADLQRANARLQDSQAHLVQSERMSALGQLMAGLAHEIDTALIPVRGSVDLLGGPAAPLAALAARSQEFVQMMRDPQRHLDREQFNRDFRALEAATREVARLGLPDAAGTRLADGRHGVGQIAEIVAGLKDFSPPDGAKASEFSVHDSLESALALARHLLKTRVQVHKEFGEVPTIHGSLSQISQVFLNLLMNAAQAIPEGRIEPGMIVLRTRMDGRHMVRVEIQDNGSGIPEHVLPRIFDPFFTTAEGGQGTGMGLSVSFGIVQEHGGMILVDTELGTGTVFAVLLPVRSRRSAAPQAAGALASA
jgi:two-component system, NtrC family, sensor kinase